MYYFNLFIHIVVLLAVNLQLQSIRKGLVRIYGPEVKRYLAMDSNGRLFSTVSSVKYLDRFLFCLNRLELHDLLLNYGNFYILCLMNFDYIDYIKASCSVVGSILNQSDQSILSAAIRSRLWDLLLVLLARLQKNCKKGMGKHYFQDKFVNRS